MDVKKLYLELDSKPLKQIAAENSLSRQQLVRLWDQAGLTGRTPADPSQSEIAAAVKKIQATWTESQRNRRWIAARLIRRNASFSYMDGR